jgi:predicted aspartyl protease
VILLVLLCSCVALAERQGWQWQEVDWRMSGLSRIKAISYPADKPPPILDQHHRGQSKVRVKEITPSSTAALGQSPTGPILASVIDSPPIGGFVPWIVLSVTDADVGGDFNAYFSEEVVGNYLTSNPQSDYAIGIYDTGASVILIGDDDAVKTGIDDAGLITPFEMELLGATGSAITYTTNPLGIFIAGLDILDSNGLLVDDSEMLGEYNVSVIVGDTIQSPNVPTAVGMPMAVNCSAAFCNNKQLWVTVDGYDFNSPYISFYALGDSSVPSYSNIIDLQLRPVDAAAVQYWPCWLLGLCGGQPDYTPYYPSLIWGLWESQSVYFLPWVNLADGSDSITGLDGFMLDTGAQVSVINRTMASGLHLSTSNPDFIVEIQDVTGSVVDANGFFIDQLQIPADGQWLEYTNVPVVVLNVQSPEGGFLDGIIGMNLFVDLNFVIKGGGMEGQAYDPTLEFEPACRITGDIAPKCGNCIVDNLDLAEFANHWLEDSNSPNWYAECDMAPPLSPDSIVDILDLAVLVEHWLEGIES